jgi:hypothetical protein
VRSAKNKQIKILVNRYDEAPYSRRRAPASSPAIAGPYESNSG